MRQEIADAIAQNKTGLVELYSVSTDRFTVYYDADPGHQGLVVDTQRVSGGTVDIQARIFNTSKGEVRALGGYAKVNITNNTNYDLVVDSIDASRSGLGIITITDLGDGRFR